MTEPQPPPEPVREILPPAGSHWTPASQAPAEARKALILRAKLGLVLLVIFAVSMILLSAFGAFNHH